MRIVKLTIAYDGTAYAGWQRQPNKPTIQETLESAIQKVTGRRSNTVASGRTDAGVHALGQVVAFRTESAMSPEVFVRALNANLPHDIAVLDAAEAPHDFRPTHDAKRKRYRYLIHDGPVRDVFLRHYAWHYVYGRLDAEAMQRAAAVLQGTHDFSSFESSGAERASSIRTVFELTIQRARAGQGDTGQGRAGHMNLPSPASGGHHGVVGAGGEGGVCSEECQLSTLASNAPVSNPQSLFPNPSVAINQGRAGESDLLTLEIEADGFLYNMVRAIVGTLVQVGVGAKPESWPGEVLRACDRRAAGPTAPPQGLCLVNVDYETKGQGG